MLTKEELAFYDQNGYILLDNIFSNEEIEACSREYDALFQRKRVQQFDLEATWQGSWDQQSASLRKPANGSVLSIHSLQNHSAIFGKMLFNSNMLEAVSELINSENILLHHTKAHLKPPGNGSPFPMHQDYHYFPFEKDTMVAVFIHLDDSSSDNGGLAVYPGSHKLGPQEDVSDVTGWHYVSQEKFPMEKAIAVNAKKGQVLIFSYLLVHGSYPNGSERQRRMLLFQLMGADDKPLSVTHVSPGQGMVLKGRNENFDANIRKRHL